MNNRLWIVAALVVLGLGAAGVVFGLNLLPTREAAEAKGTYAPWLGTWVMIWVVVAMTVVLAGFLFATGLGRRTQRTPS
jgi:heme/copper-type cytochrome/quinol oxidase subunit 2